MNPILSLKCTPQREREREMEKGLLLITAAAAFAALAVCCHGFGTWKDAQQPKVVHVGGKVMCQDCSKGWNEWVHGATPLKGCKVAVTCMDRRRRVVYYASDDTDEQGAFEVAVERSVRGMALELEGCSVRLVLSPHPACDVATDFGGGRSGVKLRRPSVVYRDLVKYTVGPFYYTSTMCDEPDTAKDDDDDEDGRQ